MTYRDVTHLKIQEHYSIGGAALANKKDIVTKKADRRNQTDRGRPG